MREIKLNRLTFVFLIALTFLPTRATAQQTECSPTLSSFSAIRNGMSYRTVVGIIGCEGSELSSSEMAGYKTIMYMWSSTEFLGGNMNAMFQNDKLMMKAQFGLK
jgi:hypothetical protein